MVLEGILEGELLCNVPNGQGASSSCYSNTKQKFEKGKKRYLQSLSTKRLGSSSSILSHPRNQQPIPF